MSPVSEEDVWWAVEASLEKEGRAGVRVLGGSMKPLIWPGTEVEVERCAPGSIAPFDVILLRREGGGFDLHRVVGRSDGTLLVRGDASRGQPDAVTPDRVLGRLRGVVLGSRSFPNAPPRLSRTFGRAVGRSLPALRSVHSALAPRAPVEPGRLVPRALELGEVDALRRFLRGRGAVPTRGRLEPWTLAMSSAEGCVLVAEDHTGRFWGALRAGKVDGSWRRLDAVFERRAQHRVEPLLDRALEFGCSPLPGRVATGGVFPLEPRAPFSELLLGGASLYGRADRALMRVREIGRRGVGAFLSAALSRDEQRRLGALLYDRAAEGYAPQRGLFAWERPWFERRMPASPGRILVGAVGAGREAAWLAARGHRVDGFDPAPEMTRRAVDTLGPEHRVRLGTYEALVGEILDGVRGPLGEFAASTYDAVVLGWGSFSHVIEASERARLITCMHRLAPRGPILLSVLPDAENDEARTSRVRDGAFRAGRLVAGFRGVAPADVPLMFTSSLGFVRRVSVRELTDLAAMTGRTFVQEPELGFPHVTLLSPGASV